MKIFIKALKDVPNEKRVQGTLCYLVKSDIKGWRYNRMRGKDGKGKLS